MSYRHPIIALTGSSGSGTSTARRAFLDVFERLDLHAALIEGDAFHRYSRPEMIKAIDRARIRGENFSHFGPTANHLRKLEALFAEYSRSGTGFTRRYLHDKDATALNVEPGTFTEWEPLPDRTDLMLYEGLHGGVVTDRVNVAQHVDLLIGLTPTINLEWIQKIHRDTAQRGYTPDDVGKTILRRMPDYVKYITPQFSHTDINFQRVPLVDTSNPFAVQNVPIDGESLLVVHVANPTRTAVDFDVLLERVPGTFMSRVSTLVVPGNVMRAALTELLTPLVERLLVQRARATPTI